MDVSSYQGFNFSTAHRNKSASGTYCGTLYTHKRVMSHFSSALYALTLPVCEVKPHFPFLFLPWICTFALWFSIPPQLILPRCYSSGWSSGVAGSVASLQLLCPEINCELALLSGWSFACSACVCVGFSGFFPLSKKMLVGGLVRLSAHVWVLPSVCYSNQN